MAFQSSLFTLEGMFEAYYDRIYNYVFYRLLDHRAAEGIVEGVFSRAVAAGGPPEDTKAQLEAWLFQMAEEALEERESAGGMATPEQEAETIISTKRLELFQALAALTEEQRKLAYYRFYENKSLEEAAPLVDMDREELEQAWTAIGMQLAGDGGQQ